MVSQSTFLLFCSKHLRDMRSTKKFEGNILWLKCADCAAEYPTFVFTGESDVVTAGHRTATDLESKELFIFEKPKITASGSDVELIKVEQEHSLPGESFQQYQRRLRHSNPRYIYKCISCPHGIASVTGRITNEELSAKKYSLVQL